MNAAAPHRTLDPDPFPAPVPDDRMEPMSPALEFRLVEPDGSVEGLDDAMWLALLTDVLRQTAAFYSRIGFAPPWICCVALDDAQPVGICSFKSAPSDGRVEIATFTLPGHEGCGVATAMA